MAKFDSSTASLRSRVLQSLKRRLRKSKQRPRYANRHTPGLESLEDRRMLATFSEANGLLNLDLDVADKQLSISATDSPPAPAAPPTGTDISSPTDTVTAIGGSSPAGQDASKAIDNMTATKYVNEGGAGSGFEVTPSAGPTVVTGLIFKTADNAPESDPGSFKLEGKLSNGEYILISQRNLSLPAARHDSTTAVAIPNSTAFSTYRLTFPTLKGTSTRMQITEVFMLGATASTGTDVSAPGDQITAIGGTSPSGQGAESVIDNQTATKYVNDGGAGSGFEVTPAAGATVLTGLGFKTSDGATDSDPASYKLEGKLPNGTYVDISQAAMSLPAARHDSSTYVPIANTLAFSAYKLTFPTLKGASGAMEITEIQLFGLAAAAVTDVTAPGDPVTAVGGTSPAGQEPAKAIDNQTATKYVNSGGAGSGYEITPASGASIVNSLAFKTADNNPDADPGSYKLEGQLGNGSYVTISEQNLALPAARHNADTRVYFANIAPFSKYRLTFPTLKGASSTMQLTEVWMFGTNVVAPTAPASGPGVMLKLNGDTWQGADTANVSGSGTDTLILSAAGVAALTGGVAVTDSASGASVKFTDSGTTTYTTPFNVTLDDVGSGTITFDGKSNFAGSASLTAATSRNIVVSAGAEVTTANGAINLSANQQATATGGDFSGILIQGTVQSTGPSSVEVKGRVGSGATSAGLAGVKLDGGKVIGGTAGTVFQVQGNGGDGNHSQAGVLIENSAQISSNGADVKVTGSGGRTNEDLNVGVWVQKSGMVTAGGSGHVFVTGTGGPEKEINVGVLIGSSGTITSDLGNVQVTGTGGGATDLFGGTRYNHGVNLESNGKITAGGAGTITVVGRAGSGNASSTGIEIGGASITSAGGTINLEGISGKYRDSALNFVTKSSLGIDIAKDGKVTHSGTGSSILLAADKLNIRDNGTVEAGANTVFVNPQTVNRKVVLGPATVGALSLTDAVLDRITTDTLVLGDNTARVITLTENITRPAKTNVRIRTKAYFEEGSFSIDTAGGRLDVPVAGPANFSESGKTLNIDLNVANSNLAITSDGTNYVLTLTGAAWSGTSSHVSGNRTGTLLVTASGKSHFDTINITDSAKGTSVTFNDSGSNAYSDTFVVELTDTTAGTIQFNGSTSFTGTAALTAITTRNIVVSSGATVATKDGEMFLSANDQRATTQGNFNGVEVKGKVEATGKGNVTVQGHIGAKSTASQLAGVKVDGGTISGGKTGDLTVRGNTTVSATAGGSSRATGSGANLNGVWVANSGTITSAGGSVDVDGQGGTGSGGNHVGVLVDSSSTIAAGGTGLVTVAGRGGAGGGVNNIGVSVSGGTITSTGSTMPGAENVKVTGFGGGTKTASLAFGVLVTSNGTITAGGKGTILVSGRGGSGTGADNHGVNITGGGKVTSASGSIAVDGVAGKTAGKGIVVDSTISHTGAGSDSGIALITDAIELTSSAIVNAGNHSLLLRPLTPGTPIDLGGHAVADITSPGDVIRQTQPYEDSMVNSSKAIDDDSFTTYNSPGAGPDHPSILTITPKQTGAVVTGLRIDTAGFSRRKPIEVSLYGTDANGGNRLLVTSDNIGNDQELLQFPNDTPYVSYQLHFKNRISPSNINGAFVVNEVELLTTSKTLFLLTDGDLDRITAGSLRIGDLESGKINVTNSITRSTKTDVFLASRKAIEGGGRIDTNGGRLSLSQNGLVAFGSERTLGGLRFYTDSREFVDTTTGFTSRGLVLVGLAPRSYQGSQDPFIPLLYLPAGVEIDGNTFSTTGRVIAVLGELRSGSGPREFKVSEFHDLFHGTVDGDVNQRIKIPIAKLLGEGFTIPAGQAATVPIDSASTFQPTKVKLADLYDFGTYTPQPRVEMNGVLKFAVLDGAGVRLDASNKIVSGPNGFTPSITPGRLSIASAETDTAGNSMPITFELGGLKFQTDRLEATYAASTKTFSIGGSATATFAGGSLSVDLGGGDVTSATDTITISLGSQVGSNDTTIAFNDNLTDEIQIDTSRNYVEFDFPLNAGASVIDEVLLYPSSSVRNSFLGQEVYVRVGNQLVKKRYVNFSDGKPLSFRFANAAADRVGVSVALGQSHGTVRFSEIEVLRKGLLTIKDGKVENSISLPLTSLNIGGSAYKPDALTLSLNQTNKQSTIKGVTSIVAGSKVDYGAIGFGVDANVTDSDTRVSSTPVIKDGQLQRFSLPLTKLSNAEFTFTNRGTNQNDFMWADVDAVNATVNVSGKSVRMERKGSVSAISHSNDTTLAIDGRLSDGDVTRPNDKVTPFGQDGLIDWKDSAARAIDDNPHLEFHQTRASGNKYSLGPPVGLEITLGTGPTVVTGLTVFQGNASSYKLEGKAPDGSFALISEGSLPQLSNVIKRFPNDKAYATYKLTFPSLTNDEHPFLKISEVELLSQDDSLTIVNGELKGFAIRVDSFSVAANGNGDKFEFKSVPGASKPLTASYSVLELDDPKRKPQVDAAGVPIVKHFAPDKTVETFEILGKATVIIPTGRVILGIHRTASAEAMLGGKGNNGLVLRTVRDAKGNVTRDGEFAFAIEKIEEGSTRFEGNDLAVRYDQTAKAFQYDGTAKWIYDKQSISASPLAGQTPSTLAGFTLHGPTKIHGQGLTANLSGATVVFDASLTSVTSTTYRISGLHLGFNADSDQATVSINGKTVPVALKFDIGRNNSELYVKTSERFNISGIEIFDPTGRLHFPNSGGNSNAHFNYEAAKVDFRVGDVKATASAKLPFNLDASGNLTVGNSATFEFEPVVIDDISFDPALFPNEKAEDVRLKGTYKNGQFTFTGKGKYRGQVDIVLGATTPRLVLERGLLKLVGFVPPKIIGTPGVSIAVPEKDRDPRRKADPNNANQVIIAGKQTLFFGGTKLELELGGGNTQGMVLDVSDPANEKLVELSATITTAFTVAGVSINASGTLKWDKVNDQLEITGAADFAFKAAGKPVTLKVNLGDDTNPGLIIKNGQLKHLQVSVSADFKVFGLDMKLEGLGIKYTPAKQEFGFFGSVKLSTPPVGGKKMIDGLMVSLGRANAPGLVIKNGDLESLDISIDGTINLFGLSATPENLRVVYSRQDNLLAITGGLKMTIANQFTATAAFPGRGLEIDLNTGKADLRGLHLSVSDVNFGALSINNISFDYEVDDKGKTTISGEAELTLPGGLTIGASISIADNELKRIGFKVERSPGIAIGQTGVFLASIEGTLDNLNDLSNFSIDATVTATVGPSMKIFGERRALVEIEGSIFVNKDKLVIDGNVELLEGLFGNGSGEVTVFFKGHQVVDVQANFRLYPGGIFRGDLHFTMDRDFNVWIETRMGVYVPDGIPKIGGKSLGTLQVKINIEPNSPRKNSYVYFLGGIKIGPAKIDFEAAVTFAGEIDGTVKIPIVGNKSFRFQIPGVREFDIPDLDALTLSALEPTLNITSVTPVAGTPGAAITYSGTSELPADTTIDLFVDTEFNSYGGHRIADDLPFSTDDRTFNWADLATYAAVPYDPTKPVYVYGSINDGTNFPVFTPYSEPIVPPDYTPAIMVPTKGDYGTNQALIFSNWTDNAIQIDDPLAAALPDSEVVVEVSAGHGTLTLAPENAKPWQNADNPLDVNRDGTVAPLDVLQIINLINEPMLLAGNSRLPASRSITSDLPYYDVDGDGRVAPIDVLIAVNFLDGGIAPPDSAIAKTVGAGVTVEGDGTGVLMLTGRAAEINALLDGIKYMPSENNFFDDEITVSVNRYPGFYVETIDASFPVMAHPLMLGTEDGSTLLPVAYEQGSGHATLLEQVRVQSAASGHISGAMISIGNYQEGKDILDLSMDDQMDLGVHATFDAHKGILHLTGFASVDEYERALQLVSFCSSGSGDKTLTVKMGDDVNSLAEVTQYVHLVAVNQAPVVDPGMGNIFELGTQPIQLLPSISVVDPEDETIASATFAFDSTTYVQGEDVLEFTGQPSITSQFDAATGVLTLTGTASSTEYTMALQSVMYKNEAASPTTGIRELTVTVSDGQAKNSKATVMERLLVVAAGTTLSGPVVSGLTTEILQTPVDETPIVLAPELTLSDDNAVIPTLIGADVRITESFVSGVDFLEVKGLPDGIEATYDPLAGVLHLSGCAPISYYEYALRQVTYSDRETARDGLPRKIEFEVHDGFTIGTPQSLTIQAEALPVVEVGFGALVYNHGQATEAVDPEVVIEYMGGATLTGATVEFVWNYMPDQDRLMFTNQNGIEGAFDEQTGVLTLTGTATVEDYQAALRSVQFHNTRVNPVPGYREVEFNARDDERVSESGDLMLANFLIDVDTDYVAPVLTLDTTSITFVENSDPLAIAPTFTITDHDTPMANGSGTIYLDGATVHIDGYVEGEDFLTFTPVAGIEGEFDTHLGQLFLSGQTLIEDYQAVIRSVNYENVSEAPTTDVRHLQITLSQGAVDDAAPLLSIDIQSLNNPPTRTSAPPADVTMLENIASTSLGMENVSYDPPSEKEPDLVYTVDIVPDPLLGHVEFVDGTIAEVGETYSLDQLHSAAFVPALNARGDSEFVYTVAGFNPILEQPDPAHLTESVKIHVNGIETLTPSDAFEAQVYRDLLNRNPTQAELDATPDDFMIDPASREQLVLSILNSEAYESLQISEMFEEYLGRPANPGEIDALYDPPHALSEDFAGPELPSSLIASDSTAVTVDNGVVTFGGDRNYLRTALSEYSFNDFTAEVTVTVGGDSSVTAEEQVVYFGMGNGQPVPENANEPDPSALVQMRVAPDGFSLDGAGLIDIKDDNSVADSTSDAGGSGTHRLRLSYNGSSQMATISIDQDYAGGDFVADHTFADIDVSDNLFDLDNANIFFGGSGNTTFDDFKITDKPIDLKLDEVRSRVIASQEYYQERGFGTHEGLVQAAFADLLGRAPTDEELAKEVESLFDASAVNELATTLASNNEGAVKQVDDLIGDLLRRPGELYELVDHARQLQSSGSNGIAASIVSSDEYFTRYGTQASGENRSQEEIEQELILQWLLGEGTPGNSVETNSFESVGVIGDGFTGRGGGTLIGSEYVLTAAHLVAGHDINRLRFTVGATSYGVSQVEIHPSYAPALVGTDRGNDIAILRLNREVVDVEPTPIYRGDLEVGDELTLVGFGAHPGDESFGTKRVGTTELDGITPRLLTWTYDDDSEATTVPGDSGSPQFVQQGDQYYLASVASGGTHQASALGDFAYNTRVDAYFEWVASVIGDE